MIRIGQEKKLDFKANFSVHELEGAVFHDKRISLQATYGQGFVELHLGIIGCRRLMKTPGDFMNLHRWGFEGWVLRTSAITPSIPQIKAFGDLCNQRIDAKNPLLVKGEYDLKAMGGTLRFNGYIPSWTRLEFV